MPRSLSRNWFVTSFLVALFPPLLGLVFDRDITLREVWRSYLFSLIYSNSIGLPLTFFVTRCLPLFRATSWPRAIGIYAVILVSFAFLGTFLGTALICSTSIVPWPYYWDVFRDAIRMSLLITLGFGFGAFAWSVLQDRLEESNRKLRAKEEEERRIRELATEARLASLESRVHPHFLFNAINSILSLIREDPRRAEHLLERMAAFLRYSLDQNQRRLVPLEQELRSVRDYLEIEQARFGPRLRFSIDASPEMAGLELPPLSLQTLVENSVKYAVSPRRAGAAITITARDGVIRVTDDGPGFSTESLPAGHGIDLLQNRLQVLFPGEEPRLTFERTPDSMTVLVRLPAPVAA